MKNETPPIQKEVAFEGSSLDDLRQFPTDIKDEAGFQLDRVQRGLEPSDWKTMPTVGEGAKELRFRDKDGWYRVVYVAKLEEFVYVLHAFSKKTNQTSKSDVELAADRYKQVVNRLKKRTKK